MKRYFPRIINKTVTSIFAQYRHLTRTSSNSNRNQTAHYEILLNKGNRGGNLEDQITVITDIPFVSSKRTAEFKGL